MTGAMDPGKRRCQILAQCPHWAPESRCERYPEDGLKGFPDAINTAFPATQVQLCIVHRMRNSVKYVPWKDDKAVTADLKRIYQAATEEVALLALDQFADDWDEKYPQISRSWRTHWTNLNTLFEDRLVEYG